MAHDPSMPAIGREADGREGGFLGTRETVPGLPMVGGAQDRTAFADGQQTLFEVGAVEQQHVGHDRFGTCRDEAEHKAACSEQEAEADGGHCVFLGG